MGTEPEWNPYAPPAATDEVVAPFALEAKEGVNYESARQPVLVCIVLTVITCGLYAPIWLMQRRAFLDSLRSRQKLEIALPVVSLVASVMHLLVLFFADQTGFESILSLASTVPLLIACFRAKSMIQEELVAMGSPNRLSGVATFFLTIYYLQWRLNRLADVARDAQPPEPRPKRKKKPRRKRVKASEQEA